MKRMVVLLAIVLLIPLAGSVNAGSFAEENKDNPLMRGLEKLHKSRPGQAVDRFRKKVEDEAVKRGTGGKTLDDLHKESQDSIKRWNKKPEESQEDDSIKGFGKPSKEPSLDYRKEPRKHRTNSRTITCLNTVNRSASMKGDCADQLFRNMGYVEFKAWRIDNGDFTGRDYVEELWLIKMDRRHELWVIQGRKSEYKYRSRGRETWSAHHMIAKAKRLKVEVELPPYGGYVIWLDETTVDKDGCKVIMASGFELYWDGSRVKKKYVAMNRLQKGEKDCGYTKSKPEKPFTPPPRPKWIEKDKSTWKNTGPGLSGLIKDLSETIPKGFLAVLNMCADLDSKVYSWDSDWKIDHVASGTYFVYTVKRGDTLSLISRKTTGSIRNWKKIKEYNIRNNNRSFDENLKIGERVYVPNYLLK